MNKPRNNTEHKFQVKFVKWLDSEGICVFSVPNGSNITLIERQNMIREGMRSGVSDLIVLRPGGKTFFLELKTEIGYQRKEQKLFQTMVEKMGFEYIIVRPNIDFKKLLRRLKG